MIKKTLLMMAMLALPTWSLAHNNEKTRVDLSLVGQFTQGAMLHGQVTNHSKLLLGKQVVTISSDGHFVIGFGRDAQLKHQLTVITNNGQISHYYIELTRRDYKIQRVNGISKKITSPNPKNVARSRRDAKQVRAARKTFSELNHYQQDFIWPVTGPISGVYGSQRFYNGKPGRPHYGVDIARKTGTLVVAPAAGMVRLFVPDMFYSGGTLIIDHGMGVSSTFLHLSAGLVKAGDIVKQGQPIAKVGSSGRATGPHLDWRMNWLNKRIDPQLLVPKMSVHHLTK
ncbi:MAG: M23 family metallopeptidase [Gammaproteobacteria bacterium]|nr:M23 family metallopeptidase [Gammaproteobacteria bacterium]